MVWLTPATGIVQRVLNRHDDTDVHINTTTQTHSGGYNGMHAGGASNPMNYDTARTETHTWVNQSREFAVIFEMDDQTYKFVDHDHIVLMPGDRIKGMWAARHDGLREFRALKNLSRGITRYYSVGLDFPNWLGFWLAGIVIAAVFLRLPWQLDVIACVIVLGFYIRSQGLRRAAARKLNACLDAPEP